MVIKNFRKSKVLAILMFVFVVAVGTFLPSTKSLAATETKPTLNSNEGTVFLYTEDTLTVEHIPSGLQKISWDSSDESVLKVKSNSKTGVSCTLTPKKTGTSTVTCTVVSEDKTYTLTSKITVKKANPFKKIYINDQNKVKSKTTTITYNTDSSKVKISTKLNKGWSLVSKEYEVYNNENKIQKSAKVPSNNKVPVGNYQTKVYFTVTNDSNESYTYNVIIKRIIGPTSKPSFAKKSGTIFLKTTDNTLPIVNFPSGATATWSTSNTKVVAVTKSKDSDSTAILTPNSKGTATITCLVTKKDKTTRTITYDVTVSKKVSPLEAVKIDGSNILGKTKNNYYKFKTTDHSVLVQSYNNSGWNFVSETYTEYNTPTNHGNEVNVASNGGVDVGTYKSVVKIILKNKAGAYYTFTLEIYNNNYQK